MVVQEGVEVLLLVRMSVVVNGDARSGGGEEPLRSGPG